MVANLNNAKDYSNGKSGNKSGNTSTNGSKPKPQKPGALVATNHFEAAGKLKAQTRKDELIQIAKAAYEQEMATLPDDIAAMLDEVDADLDVAGFFGVTGLVLEPSDSSGDTDSSAEGATIDIEAHTLEASSS
jgi:hypothetical protein